MTLGRYNAAIDSYIKPTIIEERKMNVASMDVFSRLLMDRIIFLGVPIDDDVANIIQAQLLFLASLDGKADISLYLNTPGGQVSSGLAIYDTMQLIAPPVGTICTGMAASMGALPEHIPESSCEVPGFLVDFLSRGIHVIHPCFRFFRDEHTAEESF